MVAGCGGGGPSRSLAFRIDLPWHKPLVAAPTDHATMHWALGEVTEISLDGETIQVKLTRGTFPEGALVGIYLATTKDPSPHYMWDESREMSAAEAKVTRVSEGSFEARIVAGSSNTVITAGDKVIKLVP
jgi:hypothetical protein